MFIGCHHSQQNSQALRSSWGDLWAVCRQCPSVLCPFALWSFPFCLSGFFLPPSDSQPRAPSCFIHLSPSVSASLAFHLNFYLAHLCLGCPGYMKMSLCGKRNKCLASRLKASMKRSKNINGKREGQGSYFGCATVAQTEKENIVKSQDQKGIPLELC